MYNPFGMLLLRRAWSITACVLVLLSCACALRQTRLRIAEPIKGFLAPGGEATFRLSLARGEFAHILLDQGEEDLAVDLFDSHDAKLLTVDGFDYGVESVAFVAPVGGDFRVLLRTLNKPAAAVSYRIELKELRHPLPNDWLLVTAVTMSSRAKEIEVSAKGTSSDTAALLYGRRALRSWIELKDNSAEARMLLRIGELLYHSGDFVAAKTDFACALSKSRDLQDSRTIAEALTDFGVSAWQLDQIDEAADSLSEALRIWRRLGNRRGESSALNNLALLHLQTGEWQKSLDLNLRALELIRGRKDQDEAVVMSNLGLAYLSLADYPDAADYFAKALTFLRSDNAKTARARTLINLGRARMFSGDKDGASNAFQAAEDCLSTSNDHLLQAHVFNNRGQMYLMTGQRVKALGELKSALKEYRAAGSRRGEASVLHHLGVLNSMTGRTITSLMYLSRALTIREKLGLDDDMAETMFEMARVRRSRGHLIMARSLLLSAIKTTETLRIRTSGEYFRLSYFASKQRYYEELINLLMQMHRRSPGRSLDGQAFDISERARSRVLLDALGTTRGQIRQGVDASLLGKESSLERKLNLLAMRMTRLADLANPSPQREALDNFNQTLLDYRQVESEINETNPRYSSFVRPTPLTFKKVQRSLKSNAVLLEFSLGEQESYVWAVTRDHVRGVILPRRSSLEAQARDVIVNVRAYRLRLRNQDAQEAYKRAASMLSRSLLAPVATQIKGRNLLVVNDGILHYIPFAALPDPDDPSRPLGTCHELSFLPSASTLAARQNEPVTNLPTPQKNLIVFAYPVYDKDDFRVRRAPGNGAITAARPDPRSPGLPPLPSTRLEAEYVAGVVPGAKINLGFRASKCIFSGPETREYQYLHVAAHARVDDNRPDLSGLIFSLVDENGNEQDGFLHLFDIVNLNLRAELVVASGCETALGKDVRGEGMIGLARSFLYAGAKRIVVSLWPIRDDATAEFMRLMYTAIFGSGHLRPSAALRRAQEQMSRSDRWRDPYFWSGFVLQSAGE